MALRKHYEISSGLKAPIRNSKHNRRLNPMSETPFPGGAGISEVDDNLLQNILAKLPAKSFASAACVSHAWNDICTRILSHPNFISALSLNTSLPEAVKEVTAKVLSGPIRPHFAILSVCPAFGLDEAHQLIVEILGSRIPIITCEVGGIIGRDAQTDQFGEVRFPYFNVDDDLEPASSGSISLTVGYLPGLKVDAVPLLDTEEGPNIDKFVMDLRDFSASVSGRTSPEAIIMFGDSEADMKPVLEKLDYALSQQTVIAGNESCSFRHSSTDNSKIISTHQGQELPYKHAVALVFARERTTLDGLGQIEFHFAVGAGVSAVGPRYRVVSAKTRRREFTTWLTAKREGENVTLDGEQMLNDFELEMEDLVPNYDLYIGVRKKRKYSIGSEQVKSVMSLAYHPVHEGDEQYLYVKGWDIKTGDTFCFYIPDREYALASCGTVSENFGKLKHKEIIGGFVFACCGRGEMFFERLNVDSSPILDNFPGIPLGGMFCNAEIGRGSPNLGPCDEGEEQTFVHSRSHVYSCIYLLMSYSPPSSRP